MASPLSLNSKMIEQLLLSTPGIVNVWTYKKRKKCKETCTFFVFYRSETVLWQLVQIWYTGCLCLSLGR